MLDKVLIDGTDVTSYRINWSVQTEWGNAIDAATVNIAFNIKSFLVIESGMSIKITRGRVTPEDECVFIGTITQVKPETSVYILECKNVLYDTIKNSRIKSWDRNIDPEEGIGSEIFKDICDNSKINYSPSSIQNTPSEEDKRILKFVQNDEDDFDRMKKIAEIYNYIISYDYDNVVVIFKEKGFTTYPISLKVGLEIPGQLKWEENMEHLINQLKVYGATVYDRMVETFTGPASKFTLERTPEDTEVRINHTTTNDLLKRGQEGLGIAGIDYDYIINVESKEIVFSSSVSNVWINYGAQVPMPILLKDEASINKYGGENEIPHTSTITFEDIKDLQDAINRGEAYISKYSSPFTTVENIPIFDEVLEMYGSIQPGTAVTIIDEYNDKNMLMFVRQVQKKMPHKFDLISVGDEIWSTETWQSNVVEKLNTLFNKGNKNVPILIELIDFNSDYKLEPRYLIQEMRTQTGNVGVFDHPNTKFDVSTYGTGSGAGWTDYTQTCIIQGNNIYKEFVYDTDFYDSSKSSGTTWNTTTREITLTAAGQCFTKQITLGTEYSQIKVTLGDLSGAVNIAVSGDGGTNWETVTNDIAHSFTDTDDTGVLIRLTSAAGCVLKSLTTENDTIIRPAITAELNVWSKGYGGK